MFCFYVVWGWYFIALYMDLKTVCCKVDKKKDIYQATNTLLQSYIQLQNKINHINFFILPYGKLSSSG